MKNIIVVLLAIGVLICMASCGKMKTKTLHCDRCGVAVEVEEDSNMEEDWIIYCGLCNEELFGDDPLLGGK